MDEEISTPPSEENGNMPLDTPSEQVEEVAEEAASTEQPAEPEAELFELPDGRKVDAETLSKEWKDNFLPEFTRKSQTLAELEKAKLPTNPTEKPYENPDWQPQNWAEAIKIAKDEAKAERLQEEKAHVEQRQALEQSVISQLAELKKTDPTLNENALFLHANSYREKYGVAFPDLKSAYTHMKDVAELTKSVKQSTAKDIARRNDPVSVSPGATGTKPDPSAFENAAAYLRSLKG